jgi:hypothetical protein
MVTCISFMFQLKRKPRIGIQTRTRLCVQYIYTYINILGRLQFLISPTGIESERASGNNNRNPTESWPVCLAYHFSVMVLAGNSILLIDESWQSIGVDVFLDFKGADKHFVGGWHEMHTEKIKIYLQFLWVRANYRYNFQRASQKGGLICNWRV